MISQPSGVVDADATAACIERAFTAYNQSFGEITRRARRSFEQGDWLGQRKNAVARIELYEASVQRLLGELEEQLADRLADRTLWSLIREAYASRIERHADSEFFKTFFSSVTRRIFGTVGVDLDVEFAASEVSPPDLDPAEADTQRYENRGNVQWLLDQVLADFAFETPYRDYEQTTRFIAAEIEAYCAVTGAVGDVGSIEILKNVFFRSSRAYLVGRIESARWQSPLVIALKNGDDGIVADAVILSESDVSMLFGYTRSYFHADIGHVGATVAFLKRMMPRKPIAEIYTVLGRSKQGKTERYRSLFQHLGQSADLFVHARGVRGMVMAVFTLPSYDVVFKVIRDRFDYPKTSRREDVIGRYEFVFKRDRAGRLVDAQEFRRLRFPRRRFDAELLDDLLTQCAETCRLDGDDLVVEHAYVERRLVPLNLYLDEVATPQACAAAIDYGQAIRDLALSNIFAGDLLLKNFGVSRHGRVIFYDYDELCLVTDCNFRRMPEPADEVDEMRAGAWFYVGPNDVFPEQFIDFLGFRADARAAFLEHHGELLTPEYWARLRQRLSAGEFLEVLPYTVKNWTEHRGHQLVPAHRRR